MPYIRKRFAGSDSRGHVWPQDGAVVQMPHEQAQELLLIADGGFDLVPDPVVPPDGEDAGGEQSDSGGQVTEPDTGGEQVIDEVTPEPETVTEAKPAARRGGRRKTVEE